ncbi:hypothetical protein L249_7226 [Ophiocordyceps polyrhachis-furcata BCC 54312]|uniref:Uncharacterized protein n=1 Tax=Ophiocordyceps polyrhachis-furcata BCC 54312 TaxID=1330021 RepID=A0A367LA22_9HYPO|nr:hypothetical protein L249_7226 [Ophiocordyceps polyrhachis-furcata BCC 54312]
MDEDCHDDPFLWDVDAVARHLCSLKRPCAKEPVALAAKVAEQGLDGHTLLSFEFVCSRVELFDCLGVTVGSHKASLQRAILSLRSASSAFRRWKIDFLREQSDESPPPEPALIPSNGISNAAANGQQYLEATKKHKLDASEAPSGVSLTSSVVGQDITPAPPTDNAALHFAAEAERPLKRKRVAPVQLTDGFANRAEDSPAWEYQSQHAYLGRGAISITDITAPDRLHTTRLVETAKTFATPFPFKVPPGLRSTIGRIMKLHLRATGHREALLRQGLISRLPSPSQESDEILNLSDLPDSFDEETLREIDLEEAETKMAQSLSRAIEPERVLALLQEVDTKIRTAWRENKLPRYQRKAYKLWTDATKRGTKTKQINQARVTAKTIGHRLQALKAEIAQQPYAKESEVREQARSFEQSLEDRLYNEWLAGVLESRAEPPKPKSLPRPKRRAAPKSRFPDGDEILTSSDEDDFIVPDDDDQSVQADDLDAPVEPLNESRLRSSDSKDDLAESSARSKKNEASDFELRTPIKAEYFLDLTQAETPESLRRQSWRGTSVIDLTTPTKPKSRLAQPSVSANDEDDLFVRDEEDANDESLADVEQIGKARPQHWAKEKNGPKLVICLLWRLPHFRRSRVLEAARRQDDDDLYEVTVTKQLSEPLENPTLLDKAGPETTAFDLTRIFLSFVKLKNCKEPRIMSMSAADRKRLESGKEERWGEFLKLLRENAHRFPEDSQIYRPDTLDDGIDDLEEGQDDELPESQESPSQSRKNMPKEIVQNKEAVDLRQREQRRLQEQEARRLKLRAELDLSGSMSQDKSRLIINESKTEDQPFIYVNERVGMRIKHHQIEGVRFMWNQIVTDAHTSQGCLLAHSMGLGKTMQVITLLLAIQESVKSSDPDVRSQIPEHLWSSKTLVLCPAGLVDNWMDELLLWAPDQILGPMRKVESRQSLEDRRSTVLSWADHGGILVTGYPMLQKLMAGDGEIETKLTQRPNIVVADEAHTIKNPESKAHQACSRFTTKCRIALTGSPLANNIEEYYYMIDWVAPNFLGPLKEFQQIYAKPIQQGTYQDSSRWEKRTGLRQLKVLEITVAPKVNRRTTKTCAKDDLPPKQEFVLCVPPTAMQRRLYDLYLTSLQNPCEGEMRSLDDRIFAILSNLALVVNHPSCLRKKAEMVRDKKVHAQAQEGNVLPDSLVSSILKETKVPDLSNSLMSVKTELLLIILDKARELGDKVLVFSQSLLTLNYLETVLKWQKRQVYRLDGQTPIGERQELVKRFNSGNQEVYLISTNAGGVGLNIQGANRVVIFDFKWNPVQEQQAVGRAYRIGQVKPVVVYRFVTAGTFEEDLQNRAVFKTQLASRVVDKKNPLSWSKKDAKILHRILDVPAKSLDEFVGKDSILDALILHKSNGEAIRWIMSTDTFEEEDPEEGLTAQEQRHAEDMAKMNHLRLSNPDEFERLKRETELREVERYKTGGIFVEQGTIDRSSSSAVNGAGASGATTTTGPAAETTAAGPQAAGPLPMTGINTYFGGMEREETRWNLVDSRPRPRASLFTAPLKSKAQDNFEVALRQSMEKSGYEQQEQQKATKVTLAIKQVRKEKGEGFLPDDQHWRLLTGFLQSPRFALSVASGHLSPSYLARTSKTELERRVTVLNTLSETEFDKQMKASPDKAPDPVV